MKQMTLPEFRALLRDPAWKHEQTVEKLDTDPREEIRYTHDGVERIDIPHTHGCGGVTSTLGEVTIEYHEGFWLDDFDLGTFETSIEGIHNVWTMAGLEVVDEDGDKVSWGDLADEMTDEFSDIDYSGLLVPKITDIDFDKDDTDMETFTLTVDNAPDIRFTGEHIASASTSGDNGRHDFSGRAGRWTELDLYKTKGGKWICHQIGRTQWQGEKDRFSAAVCESEAQVVNFFGHGRLAKNLYEEAGIDAAQDVE